MVIIEKLEGGYIVQHDDHRVVASAEHVANFITRFWTDVTAHIERILEERKAQAIL